jgi:2-polyprenyl-3-methyl-5-hydroxy-6-metoxy-1,4-benzoquinol methylase
MPNLSRRAVELELMDTVPQTGEALDKALEFLELTNRRFGGTGVVLSQLDAWCARWPQGRPVRLLDVGTGSADIPRSIVVWARRRGVPVQVTALERVPSIAAIARDRVAGLPEVTILNEDLFALARTGVTYDYVTACLFLHHVEPARTRLALETFDHLARCGLVVSDLRRTWPGYLAVGALALALGNAIVRHDGPLSVRRAFRASELQGLADEMGLTYLAARNESWFRVSLSGEKPDAWHTR